MRNRFHDLRKWAFRESDRILPDANFWIYVFGPTPAKARRDQTYVQAYSAALSYMLRAGVIPFLDVLVMSEFVNVLARNEYMTNHAHQKRHGSFKRFRNSSDFLPAGRMIAAQGRKVAKISQPLDHPFSAWDLNAVLNDFQKGGHDFNDQMLIELSRANRVTLLTHDGDMVEGGVDVLTANSHLLRSL